VTRPLTPSLLGKPVTDVPQGDLAALRRQARDCRGCPLWKHATQTVFGVGPEGAQVMLIGEQPGHQEDLAGAPFVGPAGVLLDRALVEADLVRDRLYVTNTVKHFKYEIRGKLRLHKRASEAEQAACRKWLAAEIAQVQPRTLVALGAMAAQTLFGNAFRITHERGKWRTLAPGVRALATWHPSAILRAPPERRDELYGQLVQDLRLLKRSQGP
jgi:uracil-DNA glycosylase